MKTCPNCNSEVVVLIHNLSNNKALKYFGIARRLPVPDTKIAESFPDQEHASLEQFLKDMAYCHQNQQNFLQFPGKQELVSCWKWNSDTEAEVRLCKTGLQSKTEECRNLLATFAKIESLKPGQLSIRLNEPLPPNMKIAAEQADGSVTSEQAWEDIKYCYRNPANSLRALDSDSSCGEVNATIEAREKACKSKGPKINPESCKGFLKRIKDLKAGRL